MIQDVLLTHYQILKALHIISVISWMAGMLYLPRLFVYHAEAGQTSLMAATFKRMEYRLLKYITNPAMFVSWIFGILLLWANQEALVSDTHWFHVKFLLLLGLSTFHGFLARWRRQLFEDRCAHSPRFFRMVNEIPTLLMIGIVFLAVLKPF